jgi:hypothetical protein
MNLVAMSLENASSVEPEVAGERRRLLRDALHHAAIAAERVVVVVEQCEAGLVEVRR